MEGFPAMISDDSNVAETPFLIFMEAEQGNQIAIFTSELIGHQLRGENVSRSFI